MCEHPPGYDTAMHAYRICPAVKGCGLWVEDYQSIGDRADWGCMRDCCANSSLGGYVCIAKMALDETGESRPLYEQLVAQCAALVMELNLWDIDVTMTVSGKPADPEGDAGRKISKTLLDDVHSPARVFRRRVCAECDRRRN